MGTGKTIAVIGAGTMGVGIAVQYAMYGFSVNLYSRSQATIERAQKTIGKNCQLLEQEEMAQPAAIAAIPERIRCTTSLEEAVQGAWYVVETIVEKEEEKRALYQQLDSMLEEDVIISSNTSYLNIFPLMPERRQPYAAIVHWFAPAYIMPLVEVVKGPGTGQDVIDRLMQLHEQCGKTAVYMDRYVPGFLVNRLQSAMTREVLFLLKHEYCTPEAIDLAVKTSLMPRGMLLGLIQRMDFAGLNAVANGVRNKTYQPAPDPDPDNILFSHVEDGNYGVKTGKGFYRYTRAPYEEIMHRRDVQLIRSVKLAKEFMAQPLHDREDEETGNG